MSFCFAHTHIFKAREGSLEIILSCKGYWIAKSESSCIYLGEYLTRVADFVPDWHGEHDCLIMDDESWFRDEIENVDDKQQQQVKKFCDKRKPVYYNAEIHDAPLLHFHSHTKLNRLLVHYYAFLHFTNPKVGNYYKRLVRDRVRYPDGIFCAAGKIVKSLSEESVTSGSEPGYFSMHIRRGKIFTYHLLTEKFPRGLFIERNTFYYCRRLSMAKNEIISRRMV